MNLYSEKPKLSKGKGLFYGSFSSLTLFLFIGLIMWGCPQYNVWQQRLSGKAELAKAEQNRQIKIQEAQAKKEAAIFLAQADSIRAVGTAIANEIIAESINEEYLRWMFIDQLENIDDQIIYLPTEAGIPILESTRNPK